MKLRVAIAFALIVGLSPALALARTQTVHEHGSSVHDRSPHMHSHESQPHH